MVFSLDNVVWLINGAAAGLLVVSPVILIIYLSPRKFEGDSLCGSHTAPLHFLLIALPISQNLSIQLNGFSVFFLKSTQQSSCIRISCYMGFKGRWVFEIMIQRKLMH
ncbi:hypothetical protein C8J57DRAFT_42411 [Mycena rebaudengoi]|nr:hypothetical protein C8J57DRAFT_42411 [Mycena rebaudengoi]